MHICFFVAGRFSHFIFDTMRWLTAAWNRRYGSLRHVFLRSVINTPAYGSERIEFYPPVMIPYKIISGDSPASSRVPDYETVPTVPFSSIASLSYVKTTLAYIVNATRPIRLWRLPMDFKDEGLTYVLSDVILEGLAEPIEVGNITEDTPLNEAMLDDDINNLAIEEQGISGEWLERAPIASTVVPAAPLFGANKFMAAPIQTTTVVTNNLIPRYKAGTPIATPSNSSHNNSFISNFANGLGMGTRAKSSARSLEGGLVGLQNLGKWVVVLSCPATASLMISISISTCFMNSALQCMSNTKELQEYFTCWFPFTSL
jgi:ubiquitin carboxyl-terminal hydrolase 4/11/15